MATVIDRRYRTILHHKVYSDIDKIMDYYEQADIPKLADEFYQELRAAQATVDLLHF